MLFSNDAISESARIRICEVKCVRQRVHLLNMDLEMHAFKDSNISFGILKH